MAFTPEKAISRTRADDLLGRFEYYLEEFDRQPPFSESQLRSHLATIKLRRRFCSVDDVLQNDDFVRSLYETLQSWGVGKRGSKLVGLPDFRDSLVRKAESLRVLEEARLDSTFGLDSVLPNLWNLIATLGIVENKHTIVAGTKCLHHILPDIVPPMDREFTQTFFGWTNSEFQYHPQACFEYAYRTLARIGVAMGVERYVRKEDWRSSASKILDNAIVGYCRVHGLESSNQRQGRRQKVKLQIAIRRLKELGIYDDIIAQADLQSRKKRLGAGD